MVLLAALSKPNCLPLQRHLFADSARSSGADFCRVDEAGMLGDLFADQYVGLGPKELASKLPRESYWVEFVFVPAAQNFTPAQRALDGQRLIGSAGRQRRQARSTHVKRAA
jgi:hypothetical protein